MADDKLGEVLERVARIETKIDNYNNLREKLDMAYGLARQNERDLGKLLDNTKWLWRTIAGAILLGVLNTMVKFK